MSLHHQRTLAAITVLLVLLSSVVPSARAQSSAEEPRNILFILTDDQAPWAIGLKDHPELMRPPAGPGSDHPQQVENLRETAALSTPNMDRIAREGAYMVNAFTPTPVCSPSRATLMTGRYGTELGITDWIHPRNEPELGLDPETVAWPEVLQQAGYTNGIVGKWHLGVPDRYHPTETGFDYFMGFRTGGNSPRDPTLEKAGETQEFEGFTPDILTDHALGFIRENQAGPFMAAVHYRAPHAPWLPLPEEDWAPYRNLTPRIPNPHYPGLDTARVKRMTREYMGSVASIDRNVGRLLDLLDELDIADNTIVIFTSDHGYNMGHNGIWHKGNGHWVLRNPPPATENIPEGQRPNMYDHSLRVPLAIRWPGEIEPGTVVTETVTFLDIFPTILQMAGVETPGNVDTRGRNFVPLLKGEVVSDWNNDLYAEYSTHHQSRTHMRMYRTDEWKLVRDFLNPDRDELYNLQADPAETTNVIDDTAHQDVVRRLHRRILERMRETSDPVVELAEKHPMSTERSPIR